MSTDIESFCIDALKSNYEELDFTYIEQFVKSDNDENMMELFNLVFRYIYFLGVNNIGLKDKKSTVDKLVTLLPLESYKFRPDTNATKLMTAFSILVARNLRRKPVNAFQYLRYCLVSNYLMLLTPQIDNTYTLNLDDTLRNRIDKINESTTNEIVHYCSTKYISIIEDLFNNNQEYNSDVSEGLHTAANKLINYLKEFAKAPFKGISETTFYISDGDESSKKITATHSEDKSFEYRIAGSEVSKNLSKKKVENGTLNLSIDGIFTFELADGQDEDNFSATINIAYKDDSTNILLSYPIKFHVHKSENEAHPIIDIEGFPMTLFEIGTQKIVKKIIVYGFPDISDYNSYLENLKQLLNELKKIEETLRGEEHFSDNVKLPSAFMLGKACIEIFEKLQKSCVDNNQDKVKTQVILSIFHAEYENSGLGKSKLNDNNINNIKELKTLLAKEKNETHLPLTDLLVTKYYDTTAGYGS
jgi:hypothetical protein